MNTEIDPCVLVAPVHQLNFIHQDQQCIDKNITASQAYRLMTSTPPIWLKIAFKIRDFLSQHLGGVQPIQGFNPFVQAPLEQGGKADFFEVIKVSDRELFLQSTDKHLSVLVVLQILPYNEQKNQLKISTSVVTYNLFGKIYMLPVGMVHGAIVRNLLRNLK
ncbi:DUF2867 domain-containing protein [Acinetobacter sp.]|uniref:DUF2867 domain-containing protein n=1 Tax=Acinetobacter sp. TaxID=472 RepID=UPI00258A65CA|nr:DUF2867 domain-containing protein [Acinetobacter sp.]